MQQYGANAWRVYNYRLEVVGKSLDKAIEEMNDRVTDINRTRKNDQVRQLPLLVAQIPKLTPHSWQSGDNSRALNKNGLSSSRVSYKLKLPTLPWKPK
jgi:hypothetical protein